jgi:hypothetical protein
MALSTMGREATVMGGGADTNVVNVRTDEQPDRSTSHGHVRAVVSLPCPTRTLRSSCE